jgi:AraC-like DNA-binding protein
MPVTTPHPALREGFPGQRMLVLPRPVVHAALRAPPGRPPLGTLPTDAGWFPDAAWHDVERPAGSPQLILIHCVRGSGWATLGPPGGARHFRIRAGQLLLIRPGLPHAYGAHGTDENPGLPWSIYWLHLAGPHIQSWHDLLTGAGLAPVLQVGDAPLLLSLYEEILDLLQRSYSTDALLAATSAAAHHLGRLLTLGHHPRDPAAATPRERIEHTIQYALSRPAARIRVPELARRAHLSPSHFAAVFQKHTGCSVLRYFTRLRMQRACELLDTTDLPIKTIAARVGFEDPLHFSRAFRKIYALSPQQYRSVRKG